jgi:nitrogen fixation/metabolism regulation signal transduction histidine kinase
VYISVVPSAPVVVVALILIFFLTTAMERYLSAKLPSVFDDVILAPKSLNLKANKLKMIEELTLYGKQYI